LANEFLTKPSAAAFLGDRQVKEIIKSLRIEFPAAPPPREAALAKPKVEKLERRKLWDTIMRLRRHGIVTAVEKNRKVRAKLPRQDFRGLEQTTINPWRLRPNAWAAFCVSTGILQCLFD
jgi:hypothetical protein